MKKHSIERMALDQLKPADYNPRSMSDAARDGLRSSIERFGLVEPLVWNRKTKTLVGGHQRLAELLNLGESEADVVVVNLGKAEEKALNLALNNETIQGDWTDELEALLQEVQSHTPDLYEELLLGDLAEDMGLEDTAESESSEIKPLKIQPPPPMTWVLIGIPTVKFGDISAVVESLTVQPDVTCEMTSNNG